MHFSKKRKKKEKKKRTQIADAGDKSCIQTSIKY